MLREASQDGPGQKENKHRSDENVVTPTSKEKDAFVLGGRGRSAGSEACGMGPLLPLSWGPGSLEEALREQHSLVGVSGVTSLRPFTWVVFVGNALCQSHPLKGWGRGSTTLECTPPPGGA